MAIYELSDLELDTVSAGTKTYKKVEVNYAKASVDNYQNTTLIIKKSTVSAGIIDNSNVATNTAVASAG